MLRIRKSLYRQRMLTKRHVIAQKINAAGCQTRASEAWNEDIYSAWKRGKETATKIAALVGSI